MPSQPDAYADGWLFSLRDAAHRCEPGVNRGRRRSGGRRTGGPADRRIGGSADRRHRQRYRIRKARTGAHAREAVNRALRAPKTSAKPAPFRPRSRGLQAPLQRAGEPPTSLYQSDAARRAIAARRRKSQAPVNHPPSPSTRLAAVGSSPRCGGGRPRLTLAALGRCARPRPDTARRCAVTGPKRQRWTWRPVRRFARRAFDSLNAPCRARKPRHMARCHVPRASRITHRASRIHARHGARRTTLDTHPPMPHALAVASLCRAHTSARAPAYAAIGRKLD
ncbi:hypothetical protein DO72_4765 [Burkholderia pseudomallei]|nr:hypothetical protein DO72_4765 [Burkholderia pseudomallei]